MSKRLKQVSLFFGAAHSMRSEVVDFHVWFSPGFSDAIEARTSGVLSLHRETKIHHRFRLACDSFFSCIFLRSFRHHFRTIDKTEMSNVKQTQEMIPLITCEISLGQYVRELVFGVNVFDLDFGVQIDSIE